MHDEGAEQVCGVAERISAGDLAAESELVHLFSQRIFALLCARTRDPEASRDLLQDVLIAVLMALRKGQLREPDKLPAFVLSIARNMAQAYLRDRSRESHDEFPEEGIASPPHRIWSRSPNARLWFAGPSIAWTGRTGRSC